MYQAPDSGNPLGSTTTSPTTLSPNLYVPIPAWTGRDPIYAIQIPKRNTAACFGRLGPGEIAGFAWRYSARVKAGGQYHIGTDLCGHVGIVHGGMLATLLDEGLARCSFSNAAERIGICR